MTIVGNFVENGSQVLNATINNDMWADNFATLTVAGQLNIALSAIFCDFQSSNNFGESYH